MENIKELQEKLDAIKKENEKKCTEKINEVLKEFNCSVTTNAICVVNGVQIMPQIVSN